MNLFEQKRITWLNKINPSFKLIFFMLVMIWLIFVHNLNVVIYFTPFLLLLYLIIGYTWQKLLLFFLPLILVFVSTAAGMILFGEGSTIWFKWGLIQISRESFYRGIHLGLRGFDFGLLGFIFALSTRPVYLFYSLMQQLKLPAKYAYSFLAAFRLLPIILEEFQILRHAFIVRGVNYLSGIKGIVQKLSFYSIPLLAQSIRRAHRIAVAMEAKRFNYEGKRTFYYVLRYSKYDLFFSFIIILAIFTAVYLGTYYPYIPITDVRLIG